MWFPVEFQTSKENAIVMVRLRKAISTDHAEQDDNDKGKKMV